MISRENIVKSITNAFLSNGATDTKSLNALSTLNQEIKSGYEPEGRKEESKEATGSGSAGQYSAPLFSGEMKEKWSEKYKKSINCNNPKGFSQRAHCQGRKKKLKESLNEAVRSEMAQLKDLARKFAKEKSQGETEKENIEKMLTILQRQFRKGMKVEMEHKMGITKAKQIALDHLILVPHLGQNL